MPVTISSRLCCRGHQGCAQANQRSSRRTFVVTAKERANAEAQAQVISSKKLLFHANAGDNDRLYGSVTAADIAERLEEACGFEIDRRRLQLGAALRDLGIFPIEIRLMPEVATTFEVAVVREGGRGTMRARRQAGRSLRRGRSRSGSCCCRSGRRRSRKSCRRRGRCRRGLGQSFRCDDIQMFANQKGDSCFEESPPLWRFTPGDGPILGAAAGGRCRGPAPA
ncbi:MAG: 50S ribosomal protein L9 [Caldilineaceae bacterium]